MNHAAVENLLLEELPSPATSLNQLKPASIPTDLELVKHVQVSLTATIGTAEISIERLFSLSEGDVVSLLEQVNEPVTLRIENRPVARGFLVAVDDHFGIEISEILSP